jgi:hypothetical protein
MEEAANSINAVRCVLYTQIVVPHSPPHNNAAAPAANGTAHSPNLARFAAASLLCNTASSVKLMGNPGKSRHRRLKNVAYVSRSSGSVHFLGSSFLMLLIVFVFWQRQSASVMEQPEEEIPLMIVLMPLEELRVRYGCECEGDGGTYH